jgi:ribosome-binding protein aMBF1 (putative translation factor)
MGRGCQSENTPLWGVPPPRRKGDERILSQLGAAIREQRKARGITQEKLAELVDLHPRIVQKMEAGELNPKATTLIRIQAAVGCPWERLLPS